MSLWESSASDDKPERAGGKIVLALIVVLALLVGGGYAAAHAVAGDKVPLGTKISGVDVGGMTRAAAIAELEATFGPRAETAIALRVEGQGKDANATTVKASDLGLRVDAAASVDAAGAGSNWSPARQWDYFTGGEDVDAVVRVDAPQLEAQLDELSEGLGTPPQDGQVNFTESGVETVAPKVGRAVDREAATDALAAAFIDGSDSVALKVTVAQPEIDAADVAQATSSFANPAMADSVSLVFGESEVVLRPKQYAGILSMEPQDGVLVPKIDAAALTELVKAATTDGMPVDATVRIKNGKPKVVRAKPGVTFDPADVARVFEGLLKAPKGERSATVAAEVTEADFTTQDAKDLRIKEKISEFKTYYPHATYRNVNIGRAAELIDGTILKPGEQFSMNAIVGERTRENGFTEGYIISNGILRQDLGGGVSQMATTAFNAMFFAGLKDIQHKPHSFYIDRYPVGREATVAWPTVDLKFENDSPYGVLIKAWITPSTYSSQGVVTVQMWSTKVWDIDSTTSDRYAYVAPQVRKLKTPDCEPHTGWSGFQVDVTRIFRKHGESTVDHREKFHTVYTPSDTVECKKPGPPPEEDPDHE